MTPSAPLPKPRSRIGAKIGGEAGRVSERGRGSRGWRRAASRRAAAVRGAPQTHCVGSKLERLHPLRPDAQIHAARLPLTSPVAQTRRARRLAKHDHARIMDPKETPERNSSPPPPRLDCIKCFDALWFCYSPFHQMQSYYRYGEFDNCFGKWGALVDCLTLKTKRKAEVEQILVAREKAKPHIWTYRTVDEASEHWWRMYKHFVVMSQPLPDAASPTPKSDDL